MENLEQWTNFWLQGFPTSFAQVLPDSYIGATGNYWRSAVSSLNPGDKVLDIACGNGAVALLIADEALKNGKELEIHAADAAQIQPLSTNKNPKQLKALKKLRFHSKTPSENISSIGKNFNLITSQFGFEYSNTGKTAENIYLTLDSGGIFKAICHKTNSKPYSDCTDEVAAYELSKNKLDIPHKIKSLLSEFENTQTSHQLELNLKRVETQRKLGVLISSIESLIATHPRAAITAFIRNSTEAFLQRKLLSGKETKSQFVDFLETELKHAGRRSKDQLNAALSKEDIEKLLSKFSDLGMKTITLEEFYEEELCTGWRIEIQKP
ncbi:class I SAM-dependent methyltransferase [Microbulbifer sp. A4B17]|uniref:class I SAM-dependent methyltransferase n=1 Tax=Microbulbifer sp. A4B17 TaxID=359370 RepID=UPI001300B299|nr:class I SAM-dependent methyltransferase [Microbulbifer sp. A4B17]